MWNIDLNILNGRASGYPPRRVSGAARGGMRARALPRGSIGRGQPFKILCQVHGSAAAPGPATSFWCRGAVRAGILGSDETKATNKGFRSTVGSSESLLSQTVFGFANRN